MANTRIKDLNNTATTVPSDAYVAIDGSANGTAKISRDNLRQDTADAIAAAPSTYNLAPLTSGSVDVDKGGTGSTTVAGWKTSLQIPNVGTAANEVPTNGQLGNMSFQNSEAVTVDDLTVDGHFTGAVGKPIPVNGPTMRFDGSNDYVDFAVSTTDSAFTYNNGTDDLPYSISGWIKVNSDATQLNVLTKWSGSTATSEWLFRLHDDKTLQLWLRGGTPYFYVSSADALTSYEGQWIHVSASYAGAGPNSATSFANAASAITLYINGKSIATTTTASGAYAGMVGSTQNVWIGRQGSVFSEGEIRDVKLFNKELSAAEVKEVYSNGQLPESFAESTGSADVVTDGGFENWNTSTDLTNWSEGSAVSTAQSTDKISGTYSCKITGGGDIGSSGNNWLSQGGIAFNANKKYRLSGRVKRFSGSTNTLQFGAAYYSIIEFNGTTFSTSTSHATQLPFIGAVTSKDLGNDWYSFSIDFTTTVANTLAIGVNGSTDPYLVDDVSLVQIGSVLDARAEQFDTSTGKLYDLSGNDFVGTQSGGVSLLGRKMPIYETGTWTPSVSFGGASSGTYGIQEGRYQRTGSLVTVWGQVNNVTKSGNSGSVTVEGLPFTAAGSNVPYVGTAAYHNAASLSGQAISLIAGGTTSLLIFDSGVNGTSPLTESNYGTSTITRFTITYQIQ